MVSHFLLTLSSIFVIACTRCCCRRNLPSEANDTYLQSCKYNSATDNSCPIFQLDTIVKESNNNYGEMAAKVVPEYHHLIYPRSAVGHNIPLTVSLI